jgi:hypothetical protein
MSMKLDLYLAFHAGLGHLSSARAPGINATENKLHLIISYSQLRLYSHLNSAASIDRAGVRPLLSAHKQHHECYRCS